jgi:zinc transport system substrate-binding protein
VTRALVISAVAASALTVSAAGPLVVVSIPPQATLVERLSGGEVEVRTLLPPGASPATYSPSPRQIAELADARAWVRTGVPFEGVLVRRMREVAPGIEVVSGPAGDSPAPEGHHGHGTHDDPHVWLDPRRLAEHAGDIADLLVRLDPDSAETVGERLDALRAELADVDRRIAHRLAPFAGRPVFVYHPAFGHFTRRYGLEQIAVEVEGGEPSPRHLAEMVELAERSGVRTVFVQPQIAGRGAEALAAAIDGHVETLDPLASDPIANLEQIADAFAESFGARP